MAALGSAAIIEFEDPATPGTWTELRQDEAGWQGATFNRGPKNLVQDSGPAISQNVNAAGTFDCSFGITIWALRKYWAALSDRAQGYKGRWRISPYGKGSGMPTFTDSYLVTVMEGIGEQGRGTFIISGQVDGNVSAPTLN